MSCSIMKKDPITEISSLLPPKIIIKDNLNPKEVEIMLNQLKNENNTLSIKWWTRYIAATRYKSKKHCPELIALSKIKQFPLKHLADIKATSYCLDKKYQPITLSKISRLNWYKLPAIDALINRAKLEKKTIKASKAILH